MKLLDSKTGLKACYKTNFYIYKGFKNIHCKFIAYDSKFNSYSDKYNDEIYNGDVCELFIRYGKKDHYYEIEVAPNGTTFLADITNVNNVFKGDLINECFVKTSAKIYKNKYIVTIKIPRNKINTKKVEYNAYRIDTDGETTNKHLFALHPTFCGSFHINESIKK